LALGFLLALGAVVSGMLYPWVLGYAVDDLHAAFRADKLLTYAVLLAAVGLVQGVCRFWMERAMIGVSRYVERDVRLDVFAHLQRLSLASLHGSSTGDIMTRVVDDVFAVRGIVSPGILRAVEAGVAFLIGFAILLRIDWALTFVACAPVVGVVLIAKGLGAAIRRRAQAVQAELANLTTAVQETVTGIRTIKSFGGEEHESIRFEELNRTYVARNTKLLQLSSIYQPLLVLIIGLAGMTVLGLGGRYVILGRMTIGELVAFMGYLGLLAWPIASIGTVVDAIQRGRASMDRVADLLRTSAGGEDAPGGGVTGPVLGGIEFRDLTFRYPGSGAPVLKGVSFGVRPGESLGIVGRTGSGKSTLVRLIPRLFDAPPRTVFVDGRDVGQWQLTALRGAIGYVPQEAFLFSDTIRENILFGCDAQSDARCERAARTAHIAEEVGRLADGYETVVGERGVTLSGGQRQRIAIGRAVAVNPKILILDDAFAGLDASTEARVLDQLGQRSSVRTTIIVSHRLSAVQSCDTILVLQEGRIAERGTHDELLTLKGVYWDLYRKQVLEMELRSG
jgi:ATP-binding cassette subfamily B protein